MKTRILFVLIFVAPLFSFSQTIQPKTAQDVVTLIKKNVTCDWAEQTVDNFKAAIRKHL